MSKSRDLPLPPGVAKASKQHQKARTEAQSPVKSGRKSKGRHGLGSITKRSDGRWMFRATLPTADGGTRRITKYARTRDAIVEEARKVLGSNVVLPSAQAEDLSVRQAVEVFLRRMEGELRAATVAQYGSLLRTHVVPACGSTPLRKLARPQILALYAEMEAPSAKDRRPASRSTLRSTHAALRRLFRFAVEEGWLLEDANPMPRVKRPGGAKQGTDELRTWTADEAKRFLEVAWETHPELAPLFEVLLGTGVRIGEALGLRWRDVDLKAGTMTINQQLTKAGEFAPPKTKRARRTLNLSRHLVDVLKAHRAARPGVRDALVFTTADGTPMSQDNLRRREWAEVILDAGVPPRTIHEARHTHASLLLAAGVHVKVVSERLGHADVAVTLGTYQSVLPGMGAQAADAIDSILGR